MQPLEALLLVLVYSRFWLLRLQTFCEIGQRRVRRSSVRISLKPL
jgi:hypothetical protein